MRGSPFSSLRAAALTAAALNETAGNPYGPFGCVPLLSRYSDDSNSALGSLACLGASFFFVVETAATDMDILTDGTDKFVGGLYTGKDDASGKVFISGASNDVITMNGSTKGGLAGSIVRVTAIADNKYAVEGIVLGSGTIVTPFADA